MSVCESGNVPQRDELKVVSSDKSRRPRGIPQVYREDLPPPREGVGNWRYGHKARRPGANLTAF